MNYRDFISGFDTDHLKWAVEGIAVGFLNMEAHWFHEWIQEEIEKAYIEGTSPYPLVDNFKSLAKKDDNYLKLHKLWVDGNQTDFINWIINTLNDFNDATIRVNLENRMGLTHSINDDALRPMVILSYLPEDKIKSVSLSLNIDISGTKESRFLGGLFYKGPNWTLIKRVAAYLDTPPEDRPHPKPLSTTNITPSQPLERNPAKYKLGISLLTHRTDINHTISNVITGSAKSSGLQGGDALLQIDGEDVEPLKQQEVLQKLGNRTKDQPVNILISRRHGLLERHETLSFIINADEEESVETPPAERPHLKSTAITNKESSQHVSANPAVGQSQQPNNSTDIFHYIGAGVLGFFGPALLVTFIIGPVPGLAGAAGIVGAVGAAFLTKIYKNSQQGQSTPPPVVPRIEPPLQVVTPPEPPPNDNGTSAICPECGDTSPEEATHCISCGNKLPEIICPNCQTENISRAKFCMGCGQVR